MNPHSHGAAGRPDQGDRELRAVEAELQAFARSIDGRLRSRFATVALQRLLRRPRHWREQGRALALRAPSLWSLLAATLTIFIAIGAVLWPASPPDWLPSRIPVPEFLPVPAGIAAAAALIALATLLALERLILPRLALVGCRFRLMRLEHTGGDAAYPYVCLIAHSGGAPTGFALEGWKGIRGLSPGDFAMSISDRHGRGLAVVPLRNAGRLPVVVWDRELFQPDALPPLSEDVRALVRDFDAACERHTKHAGRIERSHALRSGQLQSPTQAGETGEQRWERAWSRVALAPPVKARLASLAAHFAAGSASATRGLLLYGPPGTGKTTIARAFADSMGCAFFPMSLTDLKSGFIGQSGENVKALWNKARAEPRSVIFVDECEAVFGRRGGTGSDSFVEEIVAAFLAQWDGFDKQTHVWVVGATNRRDLIDAALLSRFEDQLEIGLPDGRQRLEILAADFARLGIPPPLPPQTETMTAGMSGRDLNALAKRVARELGTRQPLSDEGLSTLTTAMRRQGSTATATDAGWDTLILPEATLETLKTTAGLLQHAETFRQRGIGVPRGLLLYGPPGTGKTQIARTLANETGLRFIAASTADIKQGYLGQSGQKVRELFERARESAPSLLFIDEIDIVAGARGEHNDAILTEIVGQLLQEMDGIVAQPQPVFVLAATNRRDRIDPAVLSRLPKQIEIPLPDGDAIRRLLIAMLRGKPVAFDVEAGAATIAARCAGLSGRDLRNRVEAAEHRAVARAIAAGAPDAVAIELGDFG
ncbi:MAG: AAA family ATPase [Pseudomonadota bacterium]